VWLRELAERAFAYEDRLFDPIWQNWPDLRHYYSWRATRQLSPPHQVAWCHGASGIALSRLRAFEITGDLTFAETARTAGTTILSGMREIHYGAETSYGLCHGLAGNADTLETLRARLDMPGFAGAVARVTQEIAARVISLNSKDRTDPGLMLGTAGLGAFLLQANGSIAVSLLAPTHV
jgi:lantibiotic modifying enzyme